MFFLLIAIVLTFVVIEMKDVEVNEFHPPGPFSQYWAKYYYMTILIEEYI